MNFKKFISGISALAVASSVFAGLAVTASAAVTTYVTKLNDTLDDASDTNKFSEDSITRCTISAVKAGEKYCGVELPSNCIYFDANNTSSVGSYTYDLSSYIQGDDYKIKYDFAWYSEEGKGRTASLDLRDAEGKVVVGLNLNGYKYASGKVQASPGYDIFEDTTDFNNATTFKVSTWYTLDASVKTENGSKKLSASVKTIDGATTVWSVTDKDYSGTVGDIAKIVWQNGYSVNNAAIDNIRVSVSDEVEVGSVKIVGEDTVYASAGSAKYAATVHETNGYEIEDSVTWSVTSEADASYQGEEEPSINDGVLTIPEGYAGTATIKATSNLDGSISGTKSVTIISTVGYELITLPYAKITYDDVTAYTDRNGKYTFPVGTTGEKSITVSKNGYQDKTESLQIADDQTGNISVEPNAGITYYEDFAYVTDDFGGANAANTTISNSGIKFVVADNQLSSTLTLPNPVDTAGRLITLDISAYAVNANNQVKVTLEGIGMDINYWQAGYDSKWRITDDAVTDKTENNINNYHKLQIAFVDNKAYMYLDGKLAGSVANLSEKKLTGIKITSQGYNKGFKTSVNIKSITVSDKPTDVSVKIGEADAVTYLKGSTVTIPAAKEGFEWHDAEGNVVEAGAKVVDSDLTLTETAVKNTVSKAFGFDTITAEDGVKTVKVTVDDVEKTGTIDLTGILGDLKLAILITDIPAGATTVTAVIE